MAGEDEHPRGCLLRAIRSRVLDDGRTDREHFDRTLPAADAIGVVLLIMQRNEVDQT
jgi:hypothetical protein